MKAPFQSGALGQFSHCSTSYTQCISQPHKAGDNFVGELPKSELRL